MAPTLTLSHRPRVRFHLTLSIHDLNNVPLVSGTSFVKWHLPASSSAEHRGRTPKCAIKDHRVVYDYSKSLSVKLAVGKDGMLGPVEVVFEVVQEYASGGRAERVRLGWVRGNLAEYVGVGEQGVSPVGDGAGGAGQRGSVDSSAGAGAGGEVVVRRYLMQDSKINSTLKLGIGMRHIEGTRDYYAPPLRTAPVFGGIAGIISSSEPAAAVASGTPAQGMSTAGDGENGSAPTDDGVMPSLSSTNRETGEMQDMYRRTLAAYLTSQPGEMKADECIEDIFSGGDGWGKHGRPPNVNNDNDGSQPGSGTATPNQGTGETDRADARPSRVGVAWRGSREVGSGHRYGKYGQKVKVPRKGAGEVDEFDIREDLRSWQVGEKAYS